MLSPRARSRALRRRRAVTPVIATILLLAITIILVTILYEAISLPLSTPPPRVQIASGYNQTNIVVYGEGNSPGSANCAGPSATCTAPGETFTVTSVTANIPVSAIQVLFYCDGALASQGSLASISNPATAGSSGAGAAHSALCPNQATNAAGCTNFPAWVNAALVDLVYYTPVTSGKSILSAGDEFTVFGSVCSTAIGISGHTFYYGPPGECISGAVSCYIEILYTGNPNTILATFQLQS